MIQIIPAILATTEEEYRGKIDKVNVSASLEGGWIQIDLMDNKFVQNKSISPDIIGKYPTSLNIEAHLMVEYPENWIDELIKQKVKRIIFPVEDNEGVGERIKHIKSHGIDVGLSVNPETDITSLEPFADEIDLVLVMGVNPGFGGQEFIPETLEKITAIKKKGWLIKIEVDGGINIDLIQDVVKVGVDSVVIGSYLFEGDLEENLEEIWEKLNG